MPLTALLPRYGGRDPSVQKRLLDVCGFQNYFSRREISNRPASVHHALCLVLSPGFPAWNASALTPSPPPETKARESFDVNGVSVAQRTSRGLEDGLQRRRAPRITGACCAAGPARPFPAGSRP